MMSLEEYNAARRANYSSLVPPSKNGIACPKCGKELVDSEPHITLTSNPPQTRIACESCDYSGYRVV